MYGLKRIIYDIEVLPNFFCCVMEDLNSEEHIVYELSNRKNDINSLKATFLSNLFFMGYNSFNYDDPIINFILSEEEITNIKLYKLSKEIINHQKGEPASFFDYKYNSKFKRGDIMLMLASSKLRVSLKHLQVVTKWNNVEEFECDWDSPLDESLFDSCIKYCYNDVRSLKNVCNTLNKEFKLRDYIYNTIGIDCYSKDPVKIAEYTMMDYIAKKLQRGTDKFIKEKINRNIPIKEIRINELLHPCIKFKTKKFNDVLKTYQNLILNPIEESKKKDDDKFICPIVFNDMWIVFGLGGIHHNYGKRTSKKKFKPKAMKHVPKEDELLLMPDVK